MPHLTDGEDSEQDEELEDSDKDNKTMTNKMSLRTEPPHMSNKTKNNYKRRKPKTRKPSPEIMSGSSEDFSDSDIRDEEDSKAFNDEDHPFLVSSVANLPQRDIMQLKPLQTLLLVCKGLSCIISLWGRLATEETRNA